jgi:putative FmdB family regulatory protein
LSAHPLAGNFRSGTRLSLDKMPTYEFRCPKGHEFEKFYRSISGAPHELACPTCGLIAERQMSAGGGLVFKGSGFYITDYGKDGKKSQTARPDASSGGGESGPAKSDAGVSESKPAAESKPSSEAKPTQPAPTTDKPAAKKSSGKDKSE